MEPDLPTGEVPETSPAWELELLISGAIVVGLFQLPGLIAGVFARFEPNATLATAESLSVLHMYLLAAAYALIVVFTIHLAARAYWVALIGLNSVFPGGVRWPEMKAGPAAIATYRRRFRSLAATIERIDNFCSIAFSFAFMIVLMLIFTIVLFGVGGAVGYVIAKVAFGGRYVSRLVIALVALWIAPALALNIVDRRFAKRHGQDATPPAWLRRAMRVVLWPNPTVLIGPMMFTLMTNLGRRKILVVLQIAIVSVLAIAMADRLSRADRLSLNGYDFFAMSPEHGVDYRYYDNLRPDGAPASRLPSIQSDLITDRYVKLFIPYVPAVDNDAVVAHCPRLAPLDTRGLHLHAVATVPDSLAAPVLACLASLHAATLDGAPINNLIFNFYTHPRTGERGIVAYIPSDGLAPGRHELGVTPSTSAEVDGASAPAKPWVIPFWK